MEYAWIGGVPISSIEGISQVGMNHFQTTYIEPSGTNIKETIRVSQYFPNFVKVEDSVDLMVNV